MLDIAQRRWPDVHDRRQLLLQLVAAGRDAIAPDVEASVRTQLRERQREALNRASTLIDVDELLADAAWR